jgi:hypothetical protein
MTVLKATSEDKPFAPEVEAPPTATAPAKPLQKVEQ